MSASANIVAWAVLILWLPVTVLAFARLRPATAAAVSFVGASLLLPEAIHFDLPGVPDLDKEPFAALCILMVGAAWPGPRWRRSRPGARVGTWLAIVLIAGAFITALLNEDSVAYGSRIERGLTPYDGYFDAVLAALSFALPFFIGRSLFRSSEDLRELCVVIAIGAFIYFAFIMIELRFSPQLHNWIYGFRPNRMVKLHRWGGFRPIVFMQSALAVATFMSSAAVISAMLARVRTSAVRFISPGWLFFLSLLGVLACKSVAAIVYALVFCVIARLWSLKNMRRVVLWSSAVVVLVITTRSLDLVPTDAIIETVRTLGEERAHSLEFRFMNEDMLRDKALERPFFGWGSHGRNRVYDDRGRDQSVTDGFWIIQLGKYGLVGLAGAFGLLLLPIVITVRRLHQVPKPENRMLLMGLCLFVCVRAIDMIPNGWYSGLPLLVSGAALTLSYTLAAERRPRSASDLAAQPSARAA